MSTRAETTKEGDILEQVKAEIRNFDIDAILRGAQLTVVGAWRALQNPKLFSSDVYRQARLAVVAGIIIKLAVEAPIILLHIALRVLPLLFEIDAAWWEKHVVESLSFIINTILQLPYLLMSLLNMFLINPYLDSMFMTSLDWVDQTYFAKHEKEQPSELRNAFHTNLQSYPTHPSEDRKYKEHKPAVQFLTRFSRRAVISLVAYLFSFVPVIGRFALPMSSFFTFKDAVGPIPAGIVFVVGALLPRHYLTGFLQMYYGSRSLVRELVPILGVLIYGIAEASTAYLITKIADAPPPLAMRNQYAAEQVEWNNRKEFMQTPLASSRITASSAVNNETEASGARRRRLH